MANKQAVKPGRTSIIYGQSGSGKTTQIGDYAKYIFKTTGKKTRLHSADMGGSGSQFGSLKPFINLGIISVDSYQESDDPWEWMNQSVSGPTPDDVGLEAYDSGTSSGEALLSYCAKAAAKGIQIGQQKTFKLNIPTSDGGSMVIGANNESQYGLVQTFLLDMMWKSTWLSQRHGADVIWTFGEHRAENSNEAPIVGPKLAGRALTGSIPKWFGYTFRIVSIPQLDGPAIHTLHLQEQPELGGLGMSFGNPRYPLDATTPLPSSITPASISEFWRLSEQGEQEATDNLRAELGL